MWQPSRRQWIVIWLIALAVVFGWPPDSGSSLGAKVVNWAADPMHALPDMPSSLPIELDDNGDAVAEHDMLEAAYHQARERSAMNRIRIDLKTAGDPLDPTTQRQLLVGLVILGALVVWRLGGSGTAPRVV